MYVPSSLPHSVILNHVCPNRKVNKGDSSTNTFYSKDGVLFYIKRSFIDAHARGFPPPPNTANPNATLYRLEESSSTLELLFQFMSPQRSPDLTAVDFEVLAALAEAAEKYEVFGAMEICRIHMGSK